MRRIWAILLTVAAAVGLGTFVAPGTANAATHTPVVFVHGYTGSASNWDYAETVFVAGGYSRSELFVYEYNWAQSNKTSAAGLASYVRQVLARTGATKVDIVNHSMGGLVTQWYLTQLGGTSSVRRVASVAGANHGTTFASACVIYASCVEMLPGSSFVRTISSGDETPGSTVYATWYSPCDGVIIPYTSTPLSGANNHLVACTTHIGFLSDTGSLGQIRSYLAG